MSRQPKKKRQHYVPKLILRKFSKDDRRISLLVLATGLEIKDAGLKEQCYENYFYGVDGGIEEAFGKTEAEFSGIVGDLSREHLETVTTEQVHHLREFVHYQKMRTLAAAEDINITSSALLKAVLSKDSQFSDLDLSKVQINQNNPQHASLFQAASLTPLLLDLDVKFLVSEKKIGFIISDDPVASYNQFAEHHPLLRRWPGTWGLGLKGLQMFLPISPRVCLAIYDPSTYEYGSPKRRACEVSTHDIRSLNTLQALNAHKCIYFAPDCTPQDELNRLRRERERYGDWRKPRLFEFPLTKEEHGKMGHYIGFNTPEIRLGTQFNFSRVIDRASHEGYNRGSIPIRSPKLANLAEDYGEFLKKKREEKEKQSGRNVNDPQEVAAKGSQEEE